MTASERPRPVLHFTVARGWTNDPHGVVHDGDAYHLFFQHVPDATTWQPDCHWGHATSTDLVHWVEGDIALAPEPIEVGCWSGSAVLLDRRPALLYTRIVDAADTDRAAVVLAQPAGRTVWSRRVVIGGPPQGVEVIAFRDPQLRREGGRWRAVLGGGLMDARAAGAGCALEYSSDDLVQWTYNGVLATRPDGVIDGVRTGSVWECPQLVRIDDRYVLLVSAWWEGEPRYVAYAVGDVVDGRFVAACWGRFSHGDSAYATTTFTDVDGRVCAMSWLRERTDHDAAASPWASAMSVVHVLRLDGERLVATPHPAVDAALPRVREVAVHGDDPAELGDPGTTWRLRCAVDFVGPEARLDLIVGAGGGDGTGGAAWRLRADAERLRLTCDGETLLDIPVVRPLAGRDLDVLVDTDIVEVTTSAAEGVGAARLPYLVEGPVRIRWSGSAPPLWCRFSVL